MRRHRYQTKGTLPPSKLQKARQRFMSIVDDGPKGLTNKLSDKDFTNRLIYADKQKLSEDYNNLKTEVKAFPRKETLNKVKNKFMDVVNEGPSTFYRYGGSMKYQMTGARQDNTAVNRVLPLEMEMANTANSRDEFGRTYPTQQNPGTLSAPVSLDPNSGFTRHAGESSAMSRYKEDVFKRSVQEAAADAAIGGVVSKGMRGLRALRGANKMRPSGPPNLMQKFDGPRAPRTKPGPPNIMQEFDVPRAPRTKPGPANVMQEADRAFTPKGQRGPANVTPEFDVPRAARTKPGPAQVKPEFDKPLNMSGKELEKSLPEMIERMEAKKFLEEALKKKFKHGGAARKYMKY